MARKKKPKKIKVTDEDKILAILSYCFPAAYFLLLIKNKNAYLKEHVKKGTIISTAIVVLLVANIIVQNGMYMEYNGVYKLYKQYDINMAYLQLVSLALFLTILLLQIVGIKKALKTKDYLETRA